MAASALLLAPVTPPTYHRIVSPTLTLPTGTAQAIPVGLLACQRDPLLRQLSTNIVSCTVSQSAPPPSGKNKKGSSNAAAKVPTLEVILHDTVLFPEGGGQPSDVGHITTADDKTWSVLQVKRSGGHAVHYVAVKDTAKDIDSFLPGSHVKVELGDDGYERRYDHMTMHTSQHLLSAVLETKLNLPTLSWSLTTYPQPCYVELPRPVTVEEIFAVQNEANKLVFEGRSVHVEVEELDRAQLPGVQTTETGRAVGKALPEDYTGGVKRVVVIHGVDRNPCCGTHLPSLHNLQLFLLPQTESVARAASSTSTARLYFFAGPRLLAHLGASHAQITSIANTLSCGAPQAPARVVQVTDERRRAEKRAEDVEIELARLLAKQIAHELAASSEEGKEVVTKHVHRTDDASNALGFLNSIAFSLVDAAVSAGKRFVVVLSSSPSAISSTSVNTLLIAGSEGTDAHVKAVGEALKARVGVKGGGKGTRWSGKMVGVWNERKEGAAVEEVLRGVGA
ncbi:alanyl-tRNA synthetase domain-containing protein [Coniophora puteana RWD-64-598 SS2]|uniref:Alanyl-tRNA synthetase domain-containing protein n=1 Tax=Coniophora puteana (strain RWD-64-598) TaxID=741705 RepID=A0A5M3MHY3_CONPW|nr:alanyl-tRNA synthetase domain-containing protein [Coniophora puteana RWD-64-598 SS2]EIW78255.1 alanyl-tRNA synthetase domain-containing protein [Coniophora puteana RWD-64-598 SS2]